MKIKERVWTINKNKNIAILIRQIKIKNIAKSVNGRSNIVIIC